MDRFVPQSEIRKEVLEYIWGNAGAVMASADWEEFVKTYPRLVTGLIQFIAKDVQPKAKRARRMDTCS